MLKRILVVGLLFSCSAVGAQNRWDAVDEPQVFNEMPSRVMKPGGFYAKQSAPVIVSLHGVGGRGTNNDKQLEDWNRKVAVQRRRKDFSCDIVASQAEGLWNARHLETIRSLKKTMPSVDRDRIDILGHSMGEHGTDLFIQLEPDDFAAAVLRPEADE